MTLKFKSNKFVRAFPKIFRQWSVVLKVEGKKETRYTVTVYSSSRRDKRDGTKLGYLVLNLITSLDLASRPS